MLGFIQLPTALSWLPWSARSLQLAHARLLGLYLSKGFPAIGCNQKALLVSKKKRSASTSPRVASKAFIPSTLISVSVRIINLPFG